jgi:Domain of unknown function (DUF4340)
MSQPWRLNALLALIVVALTMFVYFKSGSDAERDFPLARLKASEVTAIHIERAGDAPMMLEKKAGTWFLTVPFAGRADPLRVQRVLEIAEARSATRFAATDLARYELDAPQSHLLLNGQRFDFGMVNSLSREQYVLTENAVYPVSLRYGTALPVRAPDLLDKRLFSSDEVPVRLELQNYAVFRQDGKWKLAPGGNELSQDDYQRWVDGWRHASAARVAASMKAEPVGKIGLQFQNGRALTLAILSREPELALERPDENLVYYFLSGQAQRLLSPPAAREEHSDKR